MDVDGSDATQKLAILAHLAFGVRVNWRDISRRGIDQLDTADLRYAKELGYRVKLLAVAQLQENGVELQVSPMLVKQGAPLAEVRGASHIHHPSLAAVFPLESVEDKFLYAAELCDGETLAQRIAREGCLEPAAARSPGDNPVRRGGALEVFPVQRGNRLAAASRFAGGAARVAQARPRQGADWHRTRLFAGG
jgi:hypothetical protein